MESPLVPSSTPLQRVRTSSSLSIHSALDGRGAIRKPDLSRNRSISTSQSDRLYQLALDQANGVTTTSIPPAALGLHWITPQHSPQPQGYPDVAVEPFPQWSVPTPPRSDSGLPPVSVDASEDIVSTGITASPELAFEGPPVTSDMSSLGFLLPAQYGSGVFDSEPASYAIDGSYMPPVRTMQPQTNSAAPSAPHTSSSSPSLYQSRMTPVSNPDTQRAGELSGMSQVSNQSFNTPDYQRSASMYDSPITTTADYSMAPTQTISSVSGMTRSPMSSPHLNDPIGATAMPQFAFNRSPSMYDPSVYAPAYTSAPPTQQMYAPTHSLSYPPPFVSSSVNEIVAKPAGSSSSIRVLNQRPKPQCWEHGCNGRQFSTFSNLLRHQREKSGTASKAYCPRCGAEFTRTTARNGHLAHDKCTRNPNPARRQSDSQ